MPEFHWFMSKPEEYNSDVGVGVGVGVGAGAGAAVDNWDYGQSRGNKKCMKKIHKERCIKKRKNRKCKKCKSCSKKCKKSSTQGDMMNKSRGQNLQSNQCMTLYYQVDSIYKILQYHFNLQKRQNIADCEEIYEDIDLETEKIQEISNLSSGTGNNNGNNNNIDTDNDAGFDDISSLFDDIDQLLLQAELDLSNATF